MWPAPVAAEIVAESGFLPRRFLRPPRFGIGRAGVRRVAPFLPFEVHARIARIVTGLFDFPVFGRKTFQARPGLDQRPVHREVRVGEPAAFARQVRDLPAKFLRGLVFQPALLVRAETRMIPHRIGQVEVQKPAEAPIGVDGFHPQRLRAEGEKGLEQFGFEPPFGRNGGPSQFRIHRVEQRREFLQGRIGKGFDRPQRMIRRHKTLGRNQTQPVGLRVKAATQVRSDVQNLPGFIPTWTFSTNC